MQSSKISIEDNNREPTIEEVEHYLDFYSRNVNPGINKFTHEEQIELVLQAYYLSKSNPSGIIHILDHLVFKEGIIRGKH